MQLNDIAMPIVENVEKLIPHLQNDVKKYLALRRDAGAPNPSGLRRNVGNNIDRWVNTAVEWALRADPRYLRDSSRGKPLKNIKAPFVRHIIKWWLDPQSEGIELPEDIETTSEILQKFNNAKQQGLNADPRDFDNWRDLVEALMPFIPKGKELSSDAYTRMGLEIVFNQGPWKMYLVDKWIPGEKSTMPGNTDEVCHKAFEGTEWCVKYEHRFKNLYKGNFYIVLYRGKRFALINFPSLQFKDPTDGQIARSNPEKAEEFLRLLFAEQPDFLAELSLATLSRGSDGPALSYLGDFTKFKPLFIEELTQILQTPLARTAAERDPAHVVNLAKTIGEWPNFETWPEGYQSIIDKGKASNALEQLVEVLGRIPEIEEKLVDLSEFRKYVLWVSKAGQPKDQVQDLIDKGRHIAEQGVIGLDPELAWTTMSDGRVAHGTKTIRQAVGWLTSERVLNNGQPDPWPEMEQLILSFKDPRVAYAWARMMYNGRWEAGEPLIAQDERATKTYEKLSGVALKDNSALSLDMENPKVIVKRAIATGREFEDLEDIILQDLESAIQYAEHVIGPWPELEEKLKSNPDLQAKYRNNVLHGIF